MIVALYKDNTHLFNRLTAWWTKGLYSHSELIFSDGLSGSASFRDKGVRIKKIDYSVHPERWDFVFSLPGDECACRTHIEDLAAKGVKYSVKGLAGFVWQALSEDTKRDFCSEVCMSALGTSEAWRWHPNLILPTLEREGWVKYDGREVAYRDGIPVFA